MIERRIPNCCGSEDGELTYGIDFAQSGDAMIEIWACNTCGVLTVVSGVYVRHDGPPA